MSTSAVGGMIGSSRKDGVPGLALPVYEIQTWWKILEVGRPMRSLEGVDMAERQVSSTFALRSFTLLSYIDVKHRAVSSGDRDGLRCVTFPTETQNPKTPSFERPRFLSPVTYPQQPHAALGVYLTDGVEAVSKVPPAVGPNIKPAMLTTVIIEEIKRTGCK